jgi:hypothetical protein
VSNSSKRTAAALVCAFATGRKHKRESETEVLSSTSRPLPPIVRMAEIYERHAVLTLDADFTVYRKHGRLPLMLIHPAAR